jgi:hypothetical protein
MKQAILLAGAVALAFSGQAYAKPGHANQGKGHAHVAGQGKGAQYGKGLGGCPPGHAKHPGVCMPHGQWKKQFELGQRVPLGYNGLLGYNALPYDLRNHYGPRLDPYGRYIYDNNYLYRVDPTTMVVSEILRAVL